jgi:hypothetical protein
MTKTRSVGQRIGELSDLLFCSMSGTDDCRFTSAFEWPAQRLRLARAPDEAAFWASHFNAARLHEHRGDIKRAVRHLSAYRRLRRSLKPQDAS